MKVPALKKISAYGLRKVGSKTIIELLDGAQGYSRKLEVLGRLAQKIIKSERKFNNGYSELVGLGFIKETVADDHSIRLKLDKRLWDRNPDIIELEHRLIIERLNQSGRWLNPKTIVRDIRNTIEQRTHTKPSHFAIEVHLKTILIQHDFVENKNGLIRLAKFQVEEESLVSKKYENSSIFDFVPNNSEPSAIPNSHETPVLKNESEIDLDQNEDIFNNGYSGNANGEDDDCDEDSLEKGIDLDIFCRPPVNDDNAMPGKIIIDEKVNSSNHIGKIDYLKTISNKLSQINKIDLSESFSELLIKRNDITITITYDPSRQELLATSLHSLKGSAVTEALRMFVKSDMIGQLAIDTIKGVDFLSLCMRIVVSKYDISEIISMVERIIYEAIQLQKLKELS